MGYAGWGPGQIELELASNSWMTLEADTSFIFDESVHNKWNDAYNLLGVDPNKLSYNSGIVNYKIISKTLSLSFSRNFFNLKFISLNQLFSFISNKGFHFKTSFSGIFLSYFNTYFFPEIVKIVFILTSISI